MKQVSRSLLRTYLSQFENLTPELRKEKEQWFKSQWLSAKHILECMEVHLSKELHALIAKDEKDSYNAASASSKHFVNIGERRAIRKIRDDLFGKTFIGDE